LVLNAFHIIGPAKYNRAICNNETDFCTMESISEIPLHKFFSYLDKDGFIYGFELSSLIEYIKQFFSSSRKKDFVNPYNRNIINYILPLIYKLDRLNSIIFKGIYKKKRKEHVGNPNNRENIVARAQHIFYEYQYNHQAVVENLRLLRSKSVEDRIKLLFIEIDQLGNYSDYKWFSDLDRRSYLRYFRILKDIWTYRAQMPTNIKLKICPLWDPFTVISNSNLSELSIEQLRMFCLCVMEDMVYTGVDVEFKTLGALHVLSVLTIVSLQARANMPWLYESLI
jgi:hypothetical protein